MKFWPENNSRALAAALRWLLVVLTLGPLVSCSTLRSKLTPSATITTPAGGTLTQSGPAATPAAASLQATTITIPLTAADAGSGVARSMPAITITTTRSTATGPRAVAPPGPPSAAEVAQADGIRRNQIVMLAGLLVAGLLLWRGHPLAALFVGAGAVSLPVLARYDVAACLVGIGAALFAAWHILKARGVIGAAG